MRWIERLNRERTRWSDRLPKPEVGRFDNGMEYARWGDGPRTLLYLPGGPGSAVPNRLQGRLAGLWFRPFLDDGFRVWHLTRRRHMPSGHTIADMAADYAELVEQEFGGRVDAVLGLSLGGLIAQYLAANHGDRVGHVVVALAGSRVSEWSRDIDRRWLEALRAGRWNRAGEVFAEYLLPGSAARPVRRLIGPVLGGTFRNGAVPVSDLQVEAVAEEAFDSREALPRITVPMLFLAGDRDRIFPTELIAEAAGLVADCTVITYPGKGHMGAALGTGVPRDAHYWVRHREAASRSPVTRGVSR